MASIMVVDDQKAQRKNLAFYLKSQGHEAECAESAEEALELIAQNKFDIVITDYKMDGMSGYDLMLKTKQNSTPPRFIIMTGHGTIPLAVDFIRQGAADVLVKPFEYSAMLNAIEKSLKNEISPSRAPDNDPLKFIAHSAKMKELESLATRASASDVTILIQGEVGVGKEHFARLIHAQSGRYKGQFAVVECIEGNDVEIEKGIFGIDNNGGAGLLMTAGGGTLLLRNIEKLGVKLQARLLRYLREGVFTPSDSSQLLKTDTRIMASTTVDLKTQIESGAFRGDLFYLLNVMPAFIPPLRSRTDDILPLVKHFLSRHRSLSGCRDTTGREMCVNSKMLSRGPAYWHQAKP
jgi:DNA-binding NtrC family response regulator